jgi:uncharacterized membrane protein YeaQ/YmgE (transglycosylase-associated protein family)
MHVDAVLWILAGVVGGVLALLVVFRTIPRDPTHWIGALVFGVLGGVLGGWLLNLLGLEQANWVGSVVTAFVGATLLLVLLRKLTGAATGTKSD